MLDDADARVGVAPAWVSDSHCCDAGLQPVCRRAGWGFLLRVTGCMWRGAGRVYGQVTPTRFELATFALKGRRANRYTTGPGGNWLSHVL